MFRIALWIGFGAAALVAAAAAARTWAADPEVPAPPPAEAPEKAEPPAVPPKAEEPPAKPPEETGPVPELDPETRTIIDYWRPINPRLVANLLRLRTEKPEEFTGQVAGLKNRKEEFENLGREDPARQAQVIEEETVRGHVDEFAFQVRQAQDEPSRETAKASLREWVKKDFNMRLRQHEVELRTREEEIKFLRLKVETWKAHPNLVIEDHFSRVIGRPGVFDF